MPAAANPAPFSSQPGDGLSLAQAVAVVYASALALVMLNAAPALEDDLRHVAHWSAAQVGALYFIELGMMALATFPAYAWRGRVSPVRVAQVGYALFTAGSLLSMVPAIGWGSYAAARALCGGGSGSLMILALSCAARARQPQRLFALITLAQLGSGAVVLALLPALSDGGRGLLGFFWLCVGLGLVGLLGARGLGSTVVGVTPAMATTPPAAAAAPAALPTAATRARSPALAWRLIGFVLAFNMVVGGIWAFVGEYAARTGLAPADLQRLLAQATLTGLAGAGLAYWLDRGPNRGTDRVQASGLGRHVAAASMVRLALCGVALGAVLLHLAQAPGLLALGCHVFSLGWNFGVPHILAAVAGQDPDGGTMPSVNLAFASGLAVGPLAAGALIGAWGPGGLLLPALLCLAFGAVLIRRL